MTVVVVAFLFFEEKQKCIEIVPTYPKHVCVYMLPCSTTFYLFPVAETSLPSFFRLLSDMRMMENSYMRKIHTYRGNHITVKRKSDAATATVTTRTAAITSSYRLSIRRGKRLSLFHIHLKFPHTTAFKKPFTKFIRTDDLIL